MMFFLIGMLICGSIAPAFAQTGSVKLTGIVSDEMGTPLPGVTIQVKGTTVGTITSNDGKYSIESSKAKGTLIFSFIGMKSQEAPFSGSGVYNAKLITTSVDLEEVVAVGYGTQKKRDLTGAISSVKGQDITMRPSTNPMEELQGKVAGLDITRTSGQAGAGVNMQLRGTRSFTASGTPMFIIDGLPGDYSTLNPNDIESIEVLKDASSTAVYGSAGSNGVIIITTKKAKVGQLKIDFNTYYGYNGWSIIPEMRTGESYLETKREAYKYVWDATASKWTKTGAIWQSATDDEAIFGTARYAIYQQGKYVNWADEFLRKSAGIQNYSLNISGGNEKTKG